MDKQEAIETADEILQEIECFATFIKTRVYGAPNDETHLSYPAECVYEFVLVGAPDYTNSQSNEGAAFVWFGSGTGLGANGTPANADWSIESNQVSAHLGTAVASAGEVTLETSEVYRRYDTVQVVLRNNTDYTIRTACLNDFDFFDASADTVVAATGYIPSEHVIGPSGRSEAEWDQRNMFTGEFVPPGEYYAQAIYWIDGDFHTLFTVTAPFVILDDTPTLPNSWGVIKALFR